MEPAGKIFAPPGVVVEGVDLLVQVVDASGRLGPGPGQQLPHVQSQLARSPRGPTLFQRACNASIEEPFLGRASERDQGVDEWPELPGLDQRLPRQAHEPGEALRRDPDHPAPMPSAEGAGRRGRLRGWRVVGRGRRSKPRPPSSPFGRGSWCVERVPIRPVFDDSPEKRRPLPPALLRGVEGRQARQVGSFNPFRTTLQASDRWTRSAAHVADCQEADSGPRAAGRSGPRRSTASEQHVDVPRCGGPARRFWAATKSSSSAWATRTAASRPTILAAPFSEWAALINDSRAESRRGGFRLPARAGRSVIRAIWPSASERNRSIREKPLRSSLISGSHPPERLEDPRFVQDVDAPPLAPGDTRPGRSCPGRVGRGSRGLSGADSQRDPVDAGDFLGRERPEFPAVLADDHQADG